jgi:hypothetical protein
MRDDPITHCLQGDGGYRFFDFAVLGRRAGAAGLKQMIQLGQALSLSATMAALSSFSDNIVGSYSERQCLRTGDKQWRQS